MTVFNNATHTLPFMVDDKLGNAERIPASDAIISALLSSKLFDGKFTIAAAAPATDQIWVDTNSAPADVKVHNGTAWVAATFDTIWDTSGFVQKSGDTMTGPLLADPGTPAAPGLSFSGATDTGFAESSGSIAVIAGGVPQMVISPTGVNIISGITSVTSTDTSIYDNTMVLNAGETGAGITLGSAGLQIERGTLTDASFIFDEADDTWKLGLLGSETAILAGATNLGAGSQIFSAVNSGSIELRSIVGGEGLAATQNANDITLDLDINGLTAEAGVDTAADQLAFYDASAGAIRKASFDTFLDNAPLAAGTII